MFNMPKTFAVAALAALVAPAFAAEWMTDLEAARAKAATEGKAVLVDFTGSDWCGWCIRLRKDVFDKPEFAEYAKDKFVLMEVDVPNNPKFDRELLKRNQELCEKYQISGFPTIMVMTPEGEIVGGFVGGRPNVEAVKAPLDAALANAAALKEAEAKEGEEKVKALHAVYQQLPEDLRESSPLRARIAELDTSNITGIQDSIKAREQMESVMRDLQMIGRDGQKALARVEEALKDAHPQNRGMLLEIKAAILLMEAKTVDDIESAKKTMLEAADALPEKAAAIRRIVEQRFADPARALQDIKRQRGE